MAVDLVPTLANLLKECLCQVVNSRDNPPAECCLRLPGDVAMDSSQYTDYCCLGLAYVSVGDMWVSADSFPEQDIVRQATSDCPPPSWGVDMKVGIQRCAPTGDEAGNPPTCEQWTASALQDMVDAQSLRMVACCFRNVYQTVEQEVGMSLVIGRITGGSPQGGCKERTMNLQVQFPSACDGC